MVVLPTANHKKDIKTLAKIFPEVIITASFLLAHVHPLVSQLAVGAPLRDVGRGRGRVPILHEHEVDGEGVGVFQAGLLTFQGVLQGVATGGLADVLSGENYTYNLSGNLWGSMTSFVNSETTFLCCTSPENSIFFIVVSWVHGK